MDKNKAHYVAVTAIIVKYGKFLIAKRSPTEKVFPNKWTVPGGKLEVEDYAKRPRDTTEAWYNVVEDLIRREVKEEVGLEIKNIRYLTNLTFIRPDNIPVFVLSMVADHLSGEVKLSPELSEYVWVGLEEAKKYDFISGIYQELEMASLHLKGRQVTDYKTHTSLQ